MVWIPDPPVIMVLFQRIEKEENLLQDTCELFWRFYLQSMGPEEFKERTEFWINKQLEDAPKGGGFMDPEIRDYILVGPEKLASVISDKLDELSEKKYIPYRSDEKEDAVALHVYLYVEASRLIRFLKSEQYSERTRDCLFNAINVFNRCNKTKEYYSNEPWSQEYTVSFYAVGSLLYATQFRIQKSDGQYEKALESLVGCYVNNMFASHQFPKYGFSNPKAEASVSLINSVGNVWEKSPWMQDLDPQEPVDCFEAILTGKSSPKLKDVADMCSFFVMVAKSWWPMTTSSDWPYEEQEIEVQDSKGETWNLPEFWQHAAGWAEAQLQPSELKDLLNEREDQAAEKRLRSYFFNGELWNKLPERIRSSLISADRDWFSGSVARKEAVFNELRIATEELLHNGLWKPLDQWIKYQNKHDNDTKWFTDREQEMTQKGLMPTLLDFERTCRLSITDAFLEGKGISNEKRIWFCSQLPKSLYHLRRARNRAEHESGNQWTRQDLNKFYSEFIGIGQLGIIQELTRILLLVNP